MNRSVHTTRLAGRRVGLLGGSFNPAHEGHLAISLAALRRLRLDEVWWLVSPQNPLKPVEGMAPLAERLASARALTARDPRLHASDIETRLGTRFTADSLAALRKRFPGIAFVWLMGADNLVQVAQWERWQEIFRTVPVAVFARPSYSFRAVAAKAAHRFAKARLAESAAATLATRRPPAWVFIHGPLVPVSATAIREQRRSAGRGTA